MSLKYLWTGMLNILHASICHACAEFITAKIALLYFMGSVRHPMVVQWNRRRETWREGPEWCSKFWTLEVVELQAHFSAISTAFILGYFLQTFSLPFLRELSVFGWDSLLKYFMHVNPIHGHACPTFTPLFGFFFFFLTCVLLSKLCKANHRIYSNCISHLALPIKIGGYVELLSRID